MIIQSDKSLIPACDVSTLERLSKLVKETCQVEGIGGYKIGSELVIRFGLERVVETIKKYTDLPIIYDHQKAGTDIPAIGERFFKACKDVDAVILFPQAGPETEKKWIKAGKERSVDLIVGGEMTHSGYLASDNGFLENDAPERIYRIAAELGVRDFVVPGNRPEKIRKYKKILEEIGIEPVFYSPGLITQGGEITEGAKAAGDKWHAIVGRAIYTSENPTAAAREMTKEIV